VCVSLDDKILTVFAYSDLSRILSGDYPVITCSIIIEGMLFPTLSLQCRRILFPVLGYRLDNRATGGQADLYVVLAVHYCDLVISCCVIGKVLYLVCSFCFPSPSYSIREASFDQIRLVLIGSLWNSLTD
jgi:hypothetical protein